MKHYLAETWRHCTPLEIKDGDDPDPVKAIETLGADLARKFSKLETDLKAANDKFDAEIAKLKRPGTETKNEGNPLEKKTFELFIRKGAEALSPDERKSLNVSDDTAGGYLAPAEFMTELLRNVRLFSPVRQVARVMTTGAGAVLLPKRTGGMTATWVGEKDTRSETTVTFGQNEYPVREIAAYVDVSNAMLEDSAFDVVQLLSFEFAEEFGGKEGTAFVNGTGVKDPFGFMNDTNVSYTPGTDASLIKADGLIDLYHAIKTPYRVNAVWGMNSGTMGVIRKLKDGNGQYLLASAGINNAPTDLLLGKPIVEMTDMPDVAGNAYPVIFGDFSQGYRIFDRVAISILRDPYSQATKGMTRFHGRRRVAGGVGKAEAIRKLKIATS
jgi:HK97 family phage major capsid protein